MLVVKIFRFMCLVGFLVWVIFKSNWFVLSGVRKCGRLVLSIMGLCIKILWFVWFMVLVFQVMVISFMVLLKLGMLNDNLVCLFVLIVMGFEKNVISFLVGGGDCSFVCDMVLLFDCMDFMVLFMLLIICL